MKRLLVALACVACGAAAEMPVPLVGPDAPPAKPADLAAAFDSGEFSAAFWVRFDSLPSKGEPTGLFGFSADKDGIASLTVRAQPTAMEGDLVCRAKTPVKKGQWHHVAFNYSLLSQRVALYIDGHLQYENDNIYLPRPNFGGDSAPVGFSGKVRGLRVYDIALTSDYLLESDRVAETAAEAKSLAAAGLDAKNPALRQWAAALQARAGAMAAGKAPVTVREAEDLARDAASVARIAGELPDARGKMGASPVVAFTVDPYSQERYLPWLLPRNGRLSGTLDIVAAKGQHESASLLVVALAPVKSFTVRVTGLACDGEKFPADALDVKLVKRWFRCGGAWLSYHRDGRQRILTPHLLVNDDDLVRVDELRTRNYLRLDYPEGTRYADVSDPADGQESWHFAIPFRDAATLQPIASLTEAGRNQQYWFTANVPADAKPGVYRGSVELVCDGKAAGSVDFRLRVLPFALPAQPSSYDNLGQTYFSHMNSLPGPEGRTHEERLASVRESMANIHAHGMNHTTGLYDDAIRAGMALEAGFVPDYIFEAPAVADWRSFYPEVANEALTTAMKKLGTRAARRAVAKRTRFLKERLPDSIPMAIFYSESAAFTTLNVAQGERAELAHAEGWQVFAHGSRKNLPYAGDIQEMTSDTAVDRVLADQWHAGGGSVIAYAQPFASPENPAIHRRRLGFERYKGAHYDGNMQHGFKTGRVPFNEFADDPGGDGSYRCVEMAMPQYGGAIYTICWEGVRAAFDDIRYATLLRKTALECLDSPRDDIRREARRQLIWLEQRDGYNTDLPMLRLAMIERILALQGLLEKEKNDAGKR